MSEELLTKTFLDAKDVCVLFNCCKTNAYKIINDLNGKLEKEGYLTIRGKVLTTFLLDKYYMKDGLNFHNESWKAKK